LALCGGIVWFTRYTDDKNLHEYQTYYDLENVMA